jgi:hypothetical protein
MKEAAMNDRVHPETVAVLIEMLVDELRLRGLSAEPFGANMLWVTNRIVGPSNGDQRKPSRRTLICRPDDDGRSAWWWLSTAQDGVPEYEWLCPAVQTATAAEAIARALTAGDA